jgi:hypothetical protein
MGEAAHQPSGKKHRRDEDVPCDGGQPPRKLRVKAYVDYHYLDNPFPDEEEFN